MKVDGQKPTKTSARVQPEQQKEAKGRKPAVFAQVLSRKKSESEEKTDSEMAGKPPAASPSQFIPVNAAEAKSGAAAPAGPLIANLVSEIVVVANTPTRQELSLEVASKVLGGLTIHMTREGGELSCQLICRTPETAALLKQHGTQLVNALATHNISLSELRIETGPRPVDGDRIKYSGDRQRGGQGGDERRGRRDR